MTDREALIEAVVSPWRDRSGRGEVRASPAFHDLDAAGRVEAATAARAARALEAAADPRGWSATVHAVESRLR
jgi:hypothetical protein